MTTCTTNSKRIKQGVTGPLWRVGVPEYDADGVATGDLVTLDANYTCRLYVPSAGTPIDRQVTDKTSDNKRFLVQLTPTDTADLSAGDTHVVAIEIENTTLTPAFNAEEHIDLAVDAGLAN